MMGLSRIFVLSIGGLALVSCGTQLKRAERTSAPAASFESSLYQGYLGLAKSETGEGDYRDSDTFAARAIAAATGSATAPEAIAARNLPGDKVAELSSARTRLVSALGGGAKDKIPGEAATAQVMFDCWMQEQEENFQPKDISACRTGFITAMDKVEGAMKPKPVAKAAPAPAPAPKAEAMKFVVYFASDSDRLDAQAQAIIDEAKAAAGKLDNASVALMGNADTVGPAAYNEALSERRAASVAEALVAGGISSGMIRTNAFGERNPALETPDNTDAAANRRVEIIVQPQ